MNTSSVSTSSMEQVSNGSATGGQSSGETKRGRATNQLRYLQNTAMKALWKHKSAWPFHVPVDAELCGCPNYYEIIKTPMDMTTIKTRLESQFYQSATECIRDFEQMFTNCKTYNRPGEVVYTMCESLEQAFQQKLTRMPAHEKEISPAGSRTKKRTPAAATAPRPQKANRGEKRKAESPPAPANAIKRPKEDLPVVQRLAPMQESSESEEGSDDESEVERDRKIAQINEQLAVVKEHIRHLREESAYKKKVKEDRRRKRMTRRKRREEQLNITRTESMTTAHVHGSVSEPNLTVPVPMDMPKTPPRQKALSSDEVDNAKPMAYDEIRQLHQDIHELSPNRLGKVVSIIRLREPSLKDSDTDGFEIDLEALKPSTLQQLKMYARWCGRRDEPNKAAKKDESAMDVCGGVVSRLSASSSSSSDNDTISSSDNDTSSSSDSSDSDSSSDSESETSDAHTNDRPLTPGIATSPTGPPKLSSITHATPSSPVAIAPPPRPITPATLPPQPAPRPSKSHQEPTSKSHQESTSKSHKEHSSKSHKEHASKFHKEHASKSHKESTSKSHKEHASKSHKEHSSKSHKEHSSKSHKESTSKSHKESTSKSHKESTSKSHKEHSSKSHKEHSSKSHKEHSSKSHKEHSSKSHKESTSKSHKESTSKSHKETTSKSHKESTSKSHKEHASKSHKEHASRSHKEHASRSHKEHSSKSHKEHSSKSHKERPSKRHKPEHVPYKPAHSATDVPPPAVNKNRGQSTLTSSSSPGSQVDLPPLPALLQPAAPHLDSSISGTDASYSPKHTESTSPKPTVDKPAAPTKGPPPTQPKFQAAKKPFELKNMDAWSALAKRASNEGNGGATFSSSCTSHQSQFSASFEAFRKQAREKEMRAKAQKEAAEMRLKHKQRAEAARKEKEEEQERAREEEQLLELSRQKAQQAAAAAQQHQQQQQQQQQAEEEKERRRQQLREQERERRRAQLANQIDLNEQSDVMALFEAQNFQC